MSSTTGGTLVFPSLAWFAALQQLVNEDPDFRHHGTVDASMGVKVGDSVFVITFEAFQCTEVREGTDYDLIDLDFFLEMPGDDWREMLQNIKEHGAADFGHTLNSLDMTREISNNATGDQLRADMFFRYNQSLQHFFDLSVRLETRFEA
jgi:hypothetical protein